MWSACVLGLYKKVSLLIFPPKIKSAPTEVDAQKTQTPIVAKLINIKHHCVHTEGIHVFIKFMV